MYVRPTCRGVRVRVLRLERSSRVLSHVVHDDEWEEYLLEETHGPYVKRGRDGYEDDGTKYLRSSYPNNTIPDKG